MNSLNEFFPPFSNFNLEAKSFFSRIQLLQFFFVPFVDLFILGAIFSKKKFYNFSYTIIDLFYWPQIEFDLFFHANFMRLLFGH